MVNLKAECKMIEVHTKVYILTQVYMRQERALEKAVLLR